MPGKPRYHVLSITPVFHGVPLPVLSMAAAARKAGIATQVWTVNDPRTAHAFWKGGVSAIVTDDPAAILRARSN
jgi:glycerophosphoryl diester phosphodiesterase